MRIFSHFTIDTFSNSYLIGPDAPGNAILVDPASFTGELLDLVEGHGYYVRYILLTHCDASHLSGLQPLLRVYTEARIIAALPSVLGYACQEVVNDEILSLDGTEVRAIAMPGMSQDSVAWHIDGFLFSGLSLTAGEYGKVPNPYARANLLENIQNSMLSLDEQTVVFPFYGPPSTVAVERGIFPTLDPTELP